jgi:coenzyme F420-0:L-glutamate ligase
MQVYPVHAPVQIEPFDLVATLTQALNTEAFALADGDILAVSSKYVAISQGRVVDLDEVTVSPYAAEIAAQYQMNPKMAQLVVDNADHVFGGIQLGFLLTHVNGIISPNAGLDRSNIPSGKVVLFPDDPYTISADLRRSIHERLGVDVGIVMTDSWLMPGRWGTTGVALACAGFRPVQDERGKADLFGNPMQVTQRGIADQLCVCAQMVMGERDEASPFAVIRNSGVMLEDVSLSAQDVSIPWNLCIYVESLTTGALPASLLSPDQTRVAGLD